MQEAVKFWEDVSGKPVSSALQAEISARVFSGADMGLIREALSLSASDKYSPAKYFAQCMKNWRADGIMSYEDYCARNSAPDRAPPKAAGTEGWNQLE